MRIEGNGTRLVLTPETQYLDSRPLTLNPNLSKDKEEGDTDPDNDELPNYIDPDS